MRDLRMRGFFLNEGNMKARSKEVSEGVKGKEHEGGAAEVYA